MKLQILLKRSLDERAHARLEKALRALGAAVTGRGKVTLSAVMPRARFEQVFGRRFEGQGGFAASTNVAGPLLVPEAVKDEVESISGTPRHLRMS